MKNRLYILWLIIALFISQAAAASEKQKDFPWDVVAIHKNNGVFGFCRAELLDKATGLTLAIALSPSFEVNIGLKVPNAGFEKGAVYPLAISFDEALKKKLDAEAALPELLLMRLGGEPSVLKAISDSKAFFAKGDVDEIKISLPQTALMVTQLKSCIEAGKIANETAAVKTLPAPKQKQGDLPIGLAALLQEAGLKVKPIKLAGQGGEDSVDYAWTVDVGGQEIDGGFREEIVDTKSAFSAHMADIVSSLKKQCKSGLKVKPSKEEKLPHLSLQVHDIQCEKEFVAMLSYKTETNILGMLMHRVGEVNKIQAVEARDRLAVIIRRLGAEKPPQEPVKK